MTPPARIDDVSFAQGDKTAYVSSGEGNLGDHGEVGAPCDPGGPARGRAKGEDSDPLTSRRARLFDR
jgi:hypothetical protein